jgi:SAM-dependent methyltransferase
MNTDAESKNPSRHLGMTEPSAWFVKHASLIKTGGSVLDVAAGGGRHARYFAGRGHPVTAVDKNTEPLDHLDAEVIGADLEDGSDWPLPGRAFDAVVVCNYLYRPLFPALIGALAPGGVLLYETFALGNEVYSRPRNPDHLLRAGELLDLVRGHLQVVAFAHGIVGTGECPGVKQMICAVNNIGMSDREDGEPAPLPIPAE